MLNAVARANRFHLDTLGRLTYAGANLLTGPAGSVLSNVIVSWKAQSTSTSTLPRTPSGTAGGSHRRGPAGRGTGDAGAGVQEPRVPDPPGGLHRVTGCSKHQPDRRHSPGRRGGRPQSNGCREHRTDGGRVVWMPTYSAQADRASKGLGGGICLLDENGRLAPEVFAVLEVVKAHDMVLATGHISTAESMALVQEARSMGIQRTVVTHATTMSYWTGMTVEDMKALAGMGAFIEHCLHVMMPTTYRMDPKDLVKAISAIGPGKCIVSSDFGQDYHPMPAEGMRMGIATLLRAGLEEVEVGMVVKDNPARLLGL